MSAVARRGWIAPVLIVLAAVVPYLGALQNGFVFDDKGLIVENDAVTKLDVGRIWSTPYWPNNPDTGLYRPLAITTFALDWIWSGGKPAGFIAVNILLHAATTLLGWAILRRVFPRAPMAAGFATLLFAVHPIHVEAVAGIVGRAEILAALFALASYLVWLRAEQSTRATERLAAPVLWFCALLSKESSLGLPALLALHRLGWIGEAAPARRKITAHDAAWPALFAILMVIRTSVLHGWITPKIPFVDNPLAHVDPLRRMLGAGGVLMRQLAQIAHGRGLSSDYSYAGVAPDTGLYALGAAGLLLLAGAGVAAFRSSRDSLTRWGVVFFAAFWILTSNLVLAIGTVQADRLLYLPLLGIGAVLGAAFTRTAGLAQGRGFPSNGRGRAVAAVALGWLAYSAVASAARVPDWHDNVRLFRSAVEATPRNLKARGNLAAVLLEEKGPSAARDVLDLIAPVEEIKDRCGPLLVREGKAYMYLGDLERARASLLASLQAEADSSEAWIEIGNIALMQEKGDEALAAFDAASHTRRRVRHAAIGRASALSILGRYEESAQAWLPLVAAMPDSVPVRVACAWNLNEAGRVTDARALIEEGLARSKDPRLTDLLASLRSSER